MPRHSQPIIDLPERGAAVDEAGVASAVSAALESHGYAYVRGHGLPGSLRTTLTRATQAFFRSPPAERERVQWSGTGPWVGYQAIGDQVDPETGLTEQIERFEITRSVVSAPEQHDIWPLSIPSFGSAWLQYYSVMEGLAARLMDLTAVTLGLPSDARSDWIENHNSNLVANYTPAGDTPRDGKVLGAHTDFGGFSILGLSAAQDGLEAEVGGQWRAVSHVPGTLVVQVGDLLSRLSNGLWPATRHRVRRRSAEMSSDRLSIVYFHQPASQAVIAPTQQMLDRSRDTRLDPVVAGDYIRTRQRDYAG